MTIKWKGSYYEKDDPSYSGAETASVSTEDHEDALLYDRYKRKQLERRIATLERRVDNLSTSVGLMDDDIFQLKEDTNKCTNT